MCLFIHLFAFVIFSDITLNTTRRKLDHVNGAMALTTRLVDISGTNRYRFPCVVTYSARLNTLFILTLLAALYAGRKQCC